MIHIKHIFKGIFKDKVHSILNIIGFSTGLACTIIVFLYVQNALSYEKNYENYERIYRYGVNMTIGDRNSSQTGCNAAVGPLFYEYMSGIEQYARTGQFGKMLVKRGEIAFSEDNFHFADSGMFKVFSYDFIYGNKNLSFKEPGKIVLSKSVSEKYFGDKNPVGEFMELEQYGSFEVIGVVKDQKQNSVIQFDALMSLSTLTQGEDLDEIYSPRRLSGGMSFKTYFLFKKNYSENDFMNEFQSFYDEYMAEFDGIQYKSIVEPIADVYLNSKIWTEWSQRNKKFLYGFISIGIFILLLASINYINIASSTAMSRSKEIAVKKVVGSSKIQLIVQILLESIMLCVLSLIISFALAEFILVFTPFNEIIGTDLEIKYTNIILIVSSFLITIFVGTLSGLFPALFLAGIAPSKTLYGKNTGKSVKGTLRNVLIAVQLVISIVAIILTLQMQNQIDFMLNKDLGFSKENIIVMQINEEDIRSKIKSFKGELTQYHGIESVSFSSASPGFPHTGYAFDWESNTGEMEAHAFRELTIDMDYFKTLGIELDQGISFTRERTANDSSIEFLVNKKLVEELGWDNPIGKRNEIGIVIGVVKDFNYSSLHGEVYPMYICQSERKERLLNIKLNGNDIESTIKYIENLWAKNLPDYEFNYTFIDDQIEFFYETDIKQKKLSNIFSILCILISTLGLFSMISLANVRKIKEVAVRKVHGATVIQILSILYKNTFYLICIASVVAIPIVYKLYSNWAQNFSYQASFSIMPYLISFLGAFVISLIISVSYSLKVARSNPVDSLRYE